ncbi:MAG: hypothetical protein ACXVBE_07770 [Bdellovibrionota bacterium]
MKGGSAVVITENRKSLKNRWISALIVFSFVAALVYSLWTATVGWNTPIMQEHSFRQTQTAFSAYYIAKGGPILKYETPVLGPPWSIPFEFPLYEVIVAKVYQYGGISLESAGRLVAKIFFYLCLLPLLLLGWQYGLRGSLLLIPLTLFLLSPLYLFWSRQVMIESSATFFGLAYLASAYRWTGTGSKTWWLVAIAMGICAALVKSTSYACYALGLGFLVLYCAWLAWKQKKLTFRWLVETGLLMLLPLIAGLAWAKFSDAQKMLNPLAGFITSSALTEWNFGTLAQRLSGDFWYKIFRQTIHDSIGHRTGWILSVALALAWGRKAALYWIFSLLFIASPLIFTNLHIIHNYYANANGVFLVLAVAILCVQTIHSERHWARAAGLCLYVVVMYFSVHEFMRQPYYLQQIVNRGPVDLGEKIAAVVPEEKVLLIYGWDWNSTISYFARRRSIMAREVNWESPSLIKSLELLKADNKEIGAVVFCSDTDKDPVLFNNPHVGSLLFKHLCSVYGWRN